MRLKCGVEPSVDSTLCETPRCPLPPRCRQEVGRELEESPEIIT